MAISCHAVLGLVVIWFCGLAISCHVVFYVGHLSAFVASTGLRQWWMAQLADTAPPFILQSWPRRCWKEKKAKEWIEKEDMEQLTGNGRKGLEGEEVPKGGKEMF